MGFTTNSHYGVVSWGKGLPDDIALTYNGADFLLTNLEIFLSYNMVYLLSNLGIFVSYNSVILSFFTYLGKFLPHVIM